MRELFTILGLFALTMQTYGQKSVNQFFDQLKKNRECLAVTLPGWMINSGTNIALKSMNEQDKREIVALGKKIKKLRFAISEDNHTISRQDFMKTIEKMKSNDQFEVYAQSRNQDGTLYIMIKEKGDKIQYLTMLYFESEVVAIVNIKSELKMKDLENANFSFNNPEFGL